MTIDKYLPKHMKNKLGISSLVILFGGASRRWGGYDSFVLN